MKGRIAWVAAVATLWLAGAFAVAATPSNATPSTAAAAPVSTQPFAFRERAFDVPVPALDHRLYSGSHVLPRRDRGIHDAQGVRMKRVDGVLKDLPRLQATYGLLNLNSYRLTGDSFFLDRALAQAGRLVANMTAAGDAWFVPTPFACHRHGNGREPIAAPYYSALAQGRTLLFFARLAAVSGEDRWRDAADRVFGAFLVVAPRRGPCVVRVDAKDHLWLEEWPWTGWTPDDTFNGHISAAFGLFEYYCLTRDARALALFRGAATTALDLGPRFRQPGWLSLYCLAHRITNPNYHHIHVGQLLVLYTMTRDAAFARLADAFESDYPDPDVRGAVRIAAGRHQVAAVAGDVATAASTVVFAEATSVKVSQRRRLRGDGVYFRLAAGPLAGRWLEEEPGRVFLPGLVSSLRYWPARALTLAAGRTYVARRYDASGAEVARATLSAGAGLAVDRGAVVDGYPSVRLSGGDLDGCWLRLGAGVTLD